MTNIEIMVDGRPALTTEQFADLAGVEPVSVRMLAKRMGLRPVAHVGAVYDLAGAEAKLETRPGRGAPGRPKPLRVNGSAPTAPTAE